MLIPLTKKKIDEIFTRHDTNSKANPPHQADVIIDIYKVVYPCWNDIEKIEGWPSISKSTSEYMFRKFITFDRKYHPRVIAGGLWMNNGFSSLDTEDMEDWVVDRDSTPLLMKGKCLECGEREVVWDSLTTAVCSECGKETEVVI